MPTAHKETTSRNSSGKSLSGCVHYTTMTGVADIDDIILSYADDSALRNLLGADHVTTLSPPGCKTWYLRICNMLGVEVPYHRGTPYGELYRLMNAPDADIAGHVLPQATQYYGERLSAKSLRWLAAVSPRLVADPGVRTVLERVLANKRVPVKVLVSMGLSSAIASDRDLFTIVRKRLGEDSHNLDNLCRWAVAGGNVKIIKRLLAKCNPSNILHISRYIGNQAGNADVLRAFRKHKALPPMDDVLPFVFRSGRTPVGRLPLSVADFGRIYPISSQSWPIPKQYAHCVGDRDGSRRFLDDIAPLATAECNQILEALHAIFEGDVHLLEAHPQMYPEAILVAMTARRWDVAVLCYKSIPGQSSGYPMIYLDTVNSLIIHAWLTDPEPILHGSDDLAVFLRSRQTHMNLVTLITTALSNVTVPFPMASLRYFVSVVGECDGSTSLYYAIWQHLLCPVKRRARRDPDFPAEEYTTTILTMMDGLPGDGSRVRLGAFPNNIPDSMRVPMVKTWCRLAADAGTPPEDIERFEFWLDWPLGSAA